jgi:peptidoglycan/xylan/chitin deacetylase (PgdA/CDA1 family)
MPILQRHGMKALFFIATGYLARRRMFWWERISLLLRRCKRGQIRIPYPAHEDLDMSSPAARRSAMRRLNRIVKDHYALDLPRFLSGLAAACGVDWSDDEDRELSDRAFMTWDQVRELRAAGMGIGSHTRDHRVLQTLSPGELAGDLAESRATLERELGERITTIAYPVGKRISHLPAVRQAVADAGYELGFTALAGHASLAPGSDRFDLNRMFVDRDVPTGVARMYLTVPGLSR